MNEILKGAFLVRPDFSYKLDLASKVTITKRPFTVTYTIKKNAIWSDKKPITSADFIFTFKTLINPNFDIVSRNGYDQISRAKALGAKKVKFTFKAPFAAYKELFSQILPAHALQGEDFNKVWNDAIVNPKNGKAIGSGPFLFQQWNKGSNLTVVRNPNFKLTHKAYLDKVIYRFITNTNSEIQALRGKEVDVIYPQPQLQLSSLRGQPGIQIQSRAGTVLEHIDLQQGPKGNDLLKNDWMRQAVAYAIDRKALTSQIFRTLQPGLPTLQSLTYVTNQKEYQAHFGKYTYQPSKVASLMSAHSCSKGGDGIYRCGGAKVSFGFTSTAGNKFRELAFEIIQDQAKRAGIELTSKFAPASVVFGPSVFEAGNFDLFMFAWVGTADPQGWGPIYDCGGSDNHKGYCNNKVTKSLQTADKTLDPRARAALVNAADTAMANDLPAIPLYQKPTYLVYQSKVKGLVDDPTSQGPTWNQENWYITR